MSDGNSSDFESPLGLREDYSSIPQHHPNSQQRNRLPSKSIISSFTDTTKPTPSRAAAAATTTKSSQTTQTAGSSAPKESTTANSTNGIKDHGPSRSNQNPNQAIVLSTQPTTESAFDRFDEIKMRKRTGPMQWDPSLQPVVDQSQSDTLMSKEKPSGDDDRTGPPNGSFHRDGINGGGGGGGGENDDEDKKSSSDDEEVDTITSLSLFRPGNGFGVPGRINNAPVRRKRPAAKSLIRRTHHRRARMRQQLFGDQEMDKAELFSIKIKNTNNNNNNNAAPRPKSPVSSKPKSTTKKATTTSSTQNKNGPSSPPRKRGPVVPEWEGKPDEKLEGGWPDGWIKRIYLRKGGNTAGQKDRYWFSPKTNYKLRSMVEVKKFMIALKQCNGDEKLASKCYKQIQL